MKTMEEIIKEKVIMSGYIKDSLYDGIKEAMKEYAEQACKEQRQECSNILLINYQKIGRCALSSKIRFAPKPKLK